MFRVSVVCALVVAGLAIAVPAIGSAGKVVFHSHENFRDSFADEFCGIQGTSVVKGVDNFQLLSDNTFRDNFEVNQVFAATASGKSVVLHVAEQVVGTDQPIDNGDGTVTVVYTFKGLPEQLRLQNGRVLSRDAGSVTFTSFLTRRRSTSSPRPCPAKKGRTPTSTATSPSSAMS